MGRAERQNNIMIWGTSHKCMGKHRLHWNCQESRPTPSLRKSRQTEDLIMNEVCVMCEIEVEKGNSERKREVIRH